MAQLSTFIIIRQGRAFSPVTIRSEGLLLGQASVCELQFSDPSMPPVVAGINEIDGRFYLVRIEPSPFDETKQLSITINGRELIREAVLAAGDLMVIGGYRLTLDKVGDSLEIRVTHLDEELTAETPVSGSVHEPVRSSPTKAAPSKPAADRGAISRKGSTQLEQWIKRRPWKTRQKVVPYNYLKPQQQKPDLGTQYNWSPTRDLALPWPASLLLLCFGVVGALAIVALIVWPTTFAPGRISSAHRQAQLSPSLLIAAMPNGNSCVHCHKLRGTMDFNCASCHQAAGFHASITKEHEAAGLACTSCHSEHKGNNFSPKAAAFTSCALCHNDNNKQTYNSKGVHTPHGGTFGYPMSGGQWIWSGLDAEALKLKPEVAVLRLPNDTERQWRSKQFHAIHLYRVKTAPGIKDVRDGVLQCSSCHTGFGENLDRQTPRQTCSKCHNGYLDNRTGTLLVARDRPNCTSCHVQHYYDSYRWGDLLTEPERDKRRRAIDRNYAEAVKQSALAR
jgi:hypothetical protein